MTETRLKMPPLPKLQPGARGENTEASRSCCWFTGEEGVASSYGCLLLRASPPPGKGELAFSPPAAVLPQRPRPAPAFSLAFREDGAAGRSR